MQEIKNKELAKFKNLIDESERWQKTKNLRDYILAFEDKHKKEDGPVEQKEWINWVNQKADWYDPLINKEDPLLGLFKPELIKEKEKDRSSYYSGYY